MLTAVSDDEHKKFEWKIIREDSSDVSSRRWWKCVLLKDFLIMFNIQLEFMLHPNASDALSSWLNDWLTWGDIMQCSSGGPRRYENALSLSVICTSIKQMISSDSYFRVAFFFFLWFFITVWEWWFFFFSPKSINPLDLFLSVNFFCYNTSRNIISLSPTTTFSLSHSLSGPGKSSWVSNPRQQQDSLFFEERHPRRVWGSSFSLLCTSYEIL